MLLTNTTMKMIRTTIMAIGAGMLLFTSCTDPNAIPDNVIQSADGLKISLEWTTGTDRETSVQEADLDLRLMRDTETVGRSENVSRFESLPMHKSLTDGEFRVDIRAYKVNKKADFKVTISDMENTRSKVYTSFFMPREELTLEFIRIVKQGETYTLSSYKKGGE